LTLQRYILRQIVIAFVFAVVGMVVIAVPGMIISTINVLGGAFIGPVLGYMPLEFVDTFQYFIPIGFLLAVVAVYGRLAADNEWTAMCMAGVSPLRLLLPGFLVATVLGALALYMGIFLDGPIVLRKHLYRRSAPLELVRTLAPGRTQFHFGDFYLSARFRDGDEFRDVVLNLPSDEESPERTLLADRLRVTVTDTHLVIHAQNAHAIDSDQDARVGSITLKRSLDAVFGPRQVDERKWKYADNLELQRMLREGLVPEERVPEARFKLHHRYARTLNCLAFLLLGAPTGLLLKRGTQLGALAIAVGYALVYYLITLRFGRVLAEQGVLPEWLGAWSSNFLSFLAGLFLTWKIART
jgi:lipopolysaccharide export system permease protein